MICSECNTQKKDGARFCSCCGREIAGGPLPMQSRLVRPRYGKVIGGVCAGFAQAYGWDAVLVRLALCATVVFGCGAPILFYLVAWLVMPKEPMFFVAPPPPMGPTDAPVAA
jgi:phage shock protein PspC (stress-responsive transcriptional regulator)